MKKLNLNVLVGGIVLSCIACQNDTGASKINESIENTKNVVQSDTYDDNELSFNKLIMTIMYNYPQSENCNIRYFLCVMKDGSMYAMTYTDEEIGFASDFFTKLYSCDNEAWEYVENVELLGTLSKEKVSLINENVVNIDIESDYFDVDKDHNGMRPQGIETASYVVYCYITTDGRSKERFKVIDGGEVNGYRYKTYDESAMDILDTVREDELYDVWRKQHISNMYD